MEGLVLHYLRHVFLRLFDPISHLCVLFVVSCCFLLSSMFSICGYFVFRDDNLYVFTMFSLGFGSVMLVLRVEAMVENRSVLVEVCSSEQDDSEFEESQERQLSGLRSELREMNREASCLFRGWRRLA